MVEADHGSPQLAVRFTVALRGIGFARFSLLNPHHGSAGCALAVDRVDDVGRSAEDRRT